MQRRNLKDAMNEMCDHTVAKIHEHVETLHRLDKDEKGELYLIDYAGELYSITK